MDRSAAAAAAIAPRSPHDDLSFEELASGYNFEKTSHDGRVFARLLVKECDKRGGRGGGVAALDIGCGSGITREQPFQWAVRQSVAEFWGLEPDHGKTPPEGLFDRHEQALMEDAELPENHFDVVYSAMVMEHVADPAAFMAGVHRCLKPGGVYMFITPNARHYFTRVASAMRRLGIDEAVLRVIRAGNLIDSYHYPVQYRFNSPRQIDACAERLGFHPPDYAYLEARGPIGYFPGPTKAIFHALAWKRRRFRDPAALIALVCRMTKR